MTPAARVQNAIEILAALDHTAQPIDRFLRGWFRDRRYAGSKDRAAVAERVYDVFRHRARYMWRMGSERPRALVIASLLSESSPECTDRGHREQPFGDIEDTGSVFQRDWIGATAMPF